VSKTLRSLVIKDAALDSIVQNFQSFKERVEFLEYIAQYRSASHEKGFMYYHYFANSIFVVMFVYMTFCRHGGVKI